MLSYILAMIVGLGSVAFYMAAFVFPEVYRKGDFIWSGVGFFYALVLWFCAGQIGGAVLLGQTASVALVAWLGWQTLKLRRETTPLAEQTSTAAISAAGMEPTAIVEKITNIFQPGKKPTPPVTPTPIPEVTPDTTEIVPDAVTEALDTATESLGTEMVDDHFEAMPTPKAEEIAASPSTMVAEESPEAISSVLPELQEMVEVIPPSPIPEFPESTPISTTEKDLGEDELEDDVDEVISAPAAVPLPPTPSVQPKSRAFGFLASLTDRVKGLLGKGKPKSSTPIQKMPSSIAKGDEEMDFPELETVEASIPTVEVADVPEVEAVESPEAMEISVSSEAESPDVEDASEVEVIEVVVSPDVDSIEVVVSPDVDRVEVVVSQEVETHESPEAIAVSESSEEEKMEPLPTVEIVVSEPVETVESAEAIDISVSSEADTSDVSRSQDSEVIVPEDDIPDSVIPPETEITDLEEETPSADQTLPTLNKPKPRPKQP
jgi:Ycf66 protein N-terminus